jgi:hypothetical protein
MKTIITYINEALKLGASKKRYSFTPKDKYELYRYIKDYIKKNGNNCDLNHIDISKLDDLSCLFQGSEFDGDISGWDVSNVEYMAQMFLESKFTGKNGDISKWDVRNVKNFGQMFDSSDIAIDLSNWEIRKGASMEFMFDNTSVKRPKWYTR